MDTFISADVRKGLERARRRATKSGNRLCVHTNGNVFRVTEAWTGGFSMPAETVENLRGLIDIYDGPKYLFQCLIVAAEVNGDQNFFEYKRMTKILEQPPVDFVRSEDAPTALLEK